MRRLRLLAVAATLVLTVAACTGGSNSNIAKNGKAISGGTATFALGPQKPDFIFPFVDIGHLTVTNVQDFQDLMYRPLYWIGDKGAPVLNDSLSLADTPRWSNGDKTVALHLKDYIFSDGTKLEPRNVAFWIGLLNSEKKNLGGYSPGRFPDNLDSVSYDDSARTVTMNLKSATSETWFDDNQLSSIVPLPLAWDVTGAGQKGSCSSETPSAQQESCPAVYAYLMKQNADVSHYASSSLWKVVDGPWQLSEFTSTGQITFVPNKTYSGPTKPKLAKFVLKSFASQSAEYNVLSSSSSVTVGYIPTQNLGKPSASGAPAPSPLPAYSVEPFYYWGFNYLLMNYNNPTVGPLFKQLYIRQALESSIDQKTDIKVAAHGYGYVESGPIPMQPTNPYIPPNEKSAPYSFSIDKARKYLTDNGWTIPSSGAATCTNPGTGAGQCGTGIAQGQQLKIKFETFSGFADEDQIVQQFQSDASKAGIVLDLRSETANQVVSNAVACKSSDASCGWQMINYGGAAYGGAYPTGDPYFHSGAGQNNGSYSDPQMDRLIEATLNSSTPSAMIDYGNYAAEQVPVLFMPQTASPITMVAKNIRGVTPQSALDNITPEDWYFVK